MKKLGFLAVLTILLGTNAFGAAPGVGSYAELGAAMQIPVSIPSDFIVGCKRLPTAQGRCNINDDEVLQISGTGCYVCEDGYCGSGHVVAVAGRATIRNNGGTYTDSLYECYRGGFGYNDKWTKIGTIPYCTGAESRKNDNNAEKRLFNITAGTAYDITNGASVSVASSSDVCFDYACKDGYTRINGQNVCVKLNAQCTDKDGKKHTTGTALPNQDCAKANVAQSTVYKLTSLSNLRDGALCTATCESGGWSITLNDDACVDKYQPNSTKKQCVKTQAAINDDNATAARRNKCTNSGGTWSGGKCTCSASKNLRLSNGECVCTNENYKRNGDQCVLTDIAQEKKDCEAAASTGAYWQDNECKCENPQHEWRAKKCQLKTYIAACDKITGAHWVNNECKCQNANQEINSERTACVASASFTVSQDINNAYSQLTAIHNTFRDKKSVWKDAEGNFNTARLASDSIAGVVLGTAGGLITSHVVKKNQVENGFEDIKCTIGGQNVAEWGDQFRVGIQ